MARLMEGTWHTEEGARVAQLHQCDLHKGLTVELARARLEQLGRNELPSPPGRSLLSMFLDQIKEILVLLLIAAAAISALLGEVTDAAVIMFIVLLNATLGVLQEHRAEQSLAALRRLSQPYARVVRSGHLQQIPVAEVVPGDLILLEAGDYVPADARLVEVATLKVDESTLTGESIPVEKTAATLSEADVPLGDRKNLVFRGTMVTYGRGKAVVTSTGSETEIGRIAALIQETPQEETPLQKRLGELGKWLGGLAIALVVLVFLAGVQHGQPAFEMFMTAVSLAVAAIPEGLPAIVTIVLALGVQRMARRRAIIRRLPAVETLGTATVICSDKTGTLTQNQMTVKKIYVDGQLIQVTGEGYEPRGKFFLLGSEEPLLLQEHPELLFLLGATALASDARLEKTDGRYRLIGDPTEGALVVAAAKAGLFKQRLDRLYPRVGEIPFDAVRKRMTTFHRTRDGLPPRLPGSALDWLPDEEACAQGGYICAAFTKGAPDTLLARCTHLLAGGEVRPLEENERTRLLQLNGRLAEEALRVLAVAYRPWNGEPSLDPEAVEQDLIFIGFLGMMDPPRPEAKAAVALSKQAGVRPVMITGDHLATAVAIARQLEIAGPDDLALTGTQLDSLSDQELAGLVDRVAVYARVSPEHKMRIVSALRARGEVTAVTGDGVNDAPALRRADIGAAMGIAGTEVAKEAADMVLADDNFATIVSAIREGRIIFANIQKAIQYLLSCNIGEILAIFSAIVLNLGRPLTAIQILWVNLVTDGLPAFALGVDPAEPDVMKKPPRDPKKGIFAEGLGFIIVLQGILLGGLTLLGYWLALRRWGGGGEGRAVAQTVAFMTLSLSQLVHSFNTRSPHQSLFRLGFFTNPHLIVAFLLSALLQIGVLEISALNGLFDVVPLSGEQWLLVVELALLPLPVVEAGKALRRTWSTFTAGRSRNSA